MSSDARPSWIAQLSEEDLAFVRRFILASGSLKEVAESYGISYPTVRLRLDRLIEKIRHVESVEADTELERVLRIELADGRIDTDTMSRILAAHDRDLEVADEKGTAARFGAGSGTRKRR
jgi:hypothetical protein